MSDFYRENHHKCENFPAASGGQKKLGFRTPKRAISRGKTVQKWVPEAKNLSSGEGVQDTPLYSEDFVTKGGVS